jgi:hypothetical protein
VPSPGLCDVVDKLIRAKRRRNLQLKGYTGKERSSGGARCVWRWDQGTERERLGECGEKREQAGRQSAKLSWFWFTAGEGGGEDEGRLSLQGNRNRRPEPDKTNKLNCECLAHPCCPPHTAGYKACTALANMSVYSDGSPSRGNFNTNCPSLLALERGMK